MIYAYSSTYEDFTYICGGYFFTFVINEHQIILWSVVVVLLEFTV